jgi:hypothetical protein
LHCGISGINANKEYADPKPIFSAAFIFLLTRKTPPPAAKFEEPQMLSGAYLPLARTMPACLRIERVVALNRI